MLTSSRLETTRFFLSSFIFLFLSSSPWFLLHSNLLFDSFFSVSLFSFICEPSISCSLAHILSIFRPLSRGLRSGRVSSRLRSECAFSRLWDDLFSISGQNIELSPRQDKEQNGSAVKKTRLKSVNNGNLMLASLLLIPSEEAKHAS